MSENETSKNTNVTAIVIIIAIAFFILCFVPFLSFPCGFCGGNGVGMRGTPGSCRTCDGKGTVNKTVWKHLNQ